MVALEVIEDVTKIEDILQNLHQNIKWVINPRVPSTVGAEGQIIDMRVLEHLDLSIKSCNVFLSQFCEESELT